MSLTYQVRKLYYGEETSYGQAATMTDVLGLVTSWDPGAELVHEDIRVGMRTIHKRIALGFNFSPSIEFLPLTGKFLKYVFGKVTNSGTAPPYTHTIEVGDSLKSLTVEVALIGASAIAERAVGLLVDSAEISFEEDGFLTASLDCRAKSVTALTSYTDPAISIPDKQPFKHRDVTVTIGTTTYGYVTSGRITINNNLAELPRSGDYIQGFVLQGAEYEGEVEIVFENFSLMNDFLSKTARNVEIKFTRGTNDYINFKLLNSYIQVSPEVPFNADELVQTVAIYPETIQVEVKDDIASY